MKKFIYILSAIFTLFLLSQTQDVQAQKSSTLSENITLNIFPNPAQTNQDINFIVNVNTNEILSYYIFDFSGKVIQESTNLKSDSFKNQIEVKVQITEKGMYFVKVVLVNEDSSSKKSKVKKFYVN